MIWNLHFLGYTDIVKVFFSPHHGQCYIIAIRGHCCAKFSDNGLGFLLRNNAFRALLYWCGPMPLLRNNVSMTLVHLCGPMPLLRNDVPTMGPRFSLLDNTRDDAGCLPPGKTATDGHGRVHKVFFAHAREWKKHQYDDNNNNKKVKKKQSCPTTCHGGTWGRGGIAPTHT
jgi:hypothetical protein